MSLLFYTAANNDYEHFVPIYIYFTLKNNPQSYVEIGLENSDQYKKENQEQIGHLRDLFGDRFKLTTVDFDGVLPGAVRFINQPELADECEYVYIGDIDIMILDSNVEETHLSNMEQNQAAFSNIIRGPSHTEGSKYRLSGLHFAPIDIQYPLPNLEDIDYSVDNDIRGADEHVLYQIMKKQCEMIPHEMDCRPVHGIHMRTGNHPFGSKKRSRPKLSFEEIAKGDQRTPWTGLEEEKYRSAFLNELTEDSFRELFFHLDIRVKNLLIILENACFGRFQEFEDEAFRYIITEAYYERLIREGVRTAYGEGVRSAAKRTIQYIYSKLR